jgi:DNA-binding CsgD family transcriptional regulator
MGKASSLRLAEVRAAFRLIGDCRDVGDDPAQWQDVAMAGACRLAGGVAATGGEGHWLHHGQSPHPIQPVTSHSFGLSDAAKQNFANYMREQGVAADPIYSPFGALPGPIVTRRRVELVSDGEWYRSTAFAYRRRAHCDHQLTSMCQVSSTHASCIAIHRGTSERDFSDRERRLLALFHVELGRLIGGPLASAMSSEPPLSPRLRQTLACLAEGDSEKQVAVRMGISRTTVHQYVTMLYRRYGVQSRAELIVKVLRRRA